MPGQNLFSIFASSKQKTQTEKGMKKTFATFLMLTLVYAGQAQLKDVMLNKAGEKLKQKQEEKQKQKAAENQQNNTGTENTGTNDTNNTGTENTGTTNTNTNTNNNPGNYGFSFGGKKEIRPEYTFNQNTLVEIENYKANGNLDEKNKMRMHFSSNPYNGMEVIDEKNSDTKTMTVFEGDKSQMITLSETKDSKTAMVIKIDQQKMNEKVAEKNAENKTTVTKTGRTKTILGYTCDEYTMTDAEGTKSEIWTTTAIPLNLSGSFAMFGGQNAKNNTFSNVDASQYPQGYMMEMTSVDSKGKKTVWKTLEVNLTAPKTVSTAGYQVF